MIILEFAIDAELEMTSPPPSDKTLKMIFWSVATGHEPKNPNIWNPILIVGILSMSIILQPEVTIFEKCGIFLN